MPPAMMEITMEILMKNKRLALLRGAMSVWISALCVMSSALAQPASTPPTPPPASPPPRTLEPIGGQAIALSEEERARELWDGVVSEHSRGAVGLYQPIKVRFNKQLVAPEALSSTPTPDTFKITPALEGYVYWSAPNELSFKPKSGWRSDQRYEVSLTPFSALETPAELPPLRFSVVARPPRFDLTPFKASFEEGGEGVTLVSEGYFDQAPTEAQREAIVRVYQDGQPLEVTWREGSREGVWSISTRATRYDEDSPLKMVFDGALMGSERRGAQRLVIPKKGAFKVTQLLPISKPSQAVYIALSEGLDPQQPLEGLVHSPTISLRLERHEGGILATPTVPVSDSLEVIIEPTLRSQLGRTLGQQLHERVVFSSVLPEVRSAQSGLIMPNISRPFFSFESRGLKSVELTALLVKEPNLGQLLQRHDLQESDRNELKRVGRYLWRKRLQLNLTPDELGTWQRHHVDLSSLLKAYPHGLFHLEVSFTRQDAQVTCPLEQALQAPQPRPKIKDQEDTYDDEPSMWSYYGWWDQEEERKQSEHVACYSTYYEAKAKNRYITQNIIASNLGILAKQGVGPERFFAITHLISARPVRGARVTLYNFQNEAINEGVTDEQGFVTIREPRGVFYAKVNHEREMGVLKLSDRQALPTTHFDVGGVRRSRGLAGVIYGERGIWRPGDELFMTFVLQDQRATLPAGHPVFVSFRDPEGVERERFTLRKSEGGFYPFTLKTLSKDPTGTWSVEVEVGGESFTKEVTIETFVPNRLQVSLRVPHQKLRLEDFPQQITLFSQWLHGAKASKLKAEVNAYVYATETYFSNADEFEFNDPTRHQKSLELSLFKGRLDAEGYARFSWDLKGLSKPTGMLYASLSSRVFEEGGGHSVEFKSVKISPLARYVGVRVPEGDKRGMLLTDQPHQVLIKTLNGKGEPVDGAPLSVKLYKIKWRWWWNKGAGRLLDIERAKSTELIQEDEVQTTQGDAEWSLLVKAPAWGRYLLKVCDTGEDQHCASDVFYIDWPGWANKTDEQRVENTYLPMSLDKDEAKVGEEVTLKLPSMPEGRALISVEVGGEMVRQRWVELGIEPTDVKVPVTPDMSPNAYLNVTALQPHAHTNDRPMRLYSLLNLKVKDPKTHLAPTLKMPLEVRPESEVTIEVAERNSMPMTYTLAVVDEGLLNVTNFQTPNLHRAFFKRLALGVRTWDLFDDVIGAYGGLISHLVQIGGSEFLEDDEDKRRRFPPVVRYMGPFKLKAGETRAHRFKLPQYVGAVRAMLVAGRQEGKHVAYGSASHKMLVRQALMILPNPPRKMGPGEELQLPVSVFASSEELTRVELFSSTSDAHSELSPRVSVAFDQPKEQEKLAFVSFKTGERAGDQALEFMAEAGGWVATKEINLPVHTAQPKSVQRKELSLQPHASLTLPFTPLGLLGTRSGTLEVSLLPQLSLAPHMSYLLGYPHGCLEQTTSKAFPQLYLSDLYELSNAEQLKVQRNIEAAIEHLKTFQTASGAFAYWPGGSAHEWATSYAGHFLLESRARGYLVPEELLNAWKARQRSLAQSWSQVRSDAQEVQAYRLLTLALAKAPELSAMNRLRQHGALTPSALWLLAHAYAISGQREAARELVKGAPITPQKVEGDLMSGFRSELRDMGLTLNALSALKDERASRLVAMLTERLNREGGNTHALATAIIALGRWAQAQANEGSKGLFKLSYQVSVPAQQAQVQQAQAQQAQAQQAQAQQAESTRPAWRHTLTPSELAGHQLLINNHNDVPLYVSFTQEGVAALGEERSQQSGLELSVSYRDEAGAEVSLEQLKGGLTQGAQLTAEVTVKRAALTKGDLGQLALTYHVPSGWSLENTRLSGHEQAERADGVKALYRDIRDDRVSVYFELKSDDPQRFSFPVRASFAGRFYHPASVVESMYRTDVRATSAGFWTLVTR